MCKENFFRPLLWSFIILSFTGCKKETMLTDDLESGYAIKIAYEEETRSTYKSLGGKTENELPLNKVHALRNKVVIAIQDDGRSTVRMTRMKPKHTNLQEAEASGKTETEVNAMIFENNQVTFLDKNENVLGREKAEMPVYLDLLKDVRKNNNKLTRAIYSDFLKTKQKNDKSTLEEAGDVIISRDVIEASSGFDPSSNGFTVSSYMDRETGVLLGSSIEDKDGITVYRSVITYDEDESNPLPAFSREENFTTDETGEISVCTTLRYVENVDIVIE